jgi:hypothetical protein
VQVEGVEVDALLALDLDEAQHLAAAHGQGLAGDGLQQQVGVERAVLHHG